MGGLTASNVNGLLVTGYIAPLSRHDPYSDENAYVICQDHFRDDWPHPRHAELTKHVFSIRTFLHSVKQWAGFTARESFLDDQVMMLVLRFLMNSFMDMLYEGMDCDVERA